MQHVLIFVTAHRDAGISDPVFSHCGAESGCSRMLWLCLVVFIFPLVAAESNSRSLTDRGRILFTSNIFSETRRGLGAAQSSRHYDPSRSCACWAIASACSARAAGCVDEQPSNTSHSPLEKSRAAGGFVQEPVPWALRNEARLLHCYEFALTCGIIILAK